LLRELTTWHSSYHDGPFTINLCPSRSSIQSGIRSIVRSEKRHRMNAHRLQPRLATNVATARMTPRFCAAQRTDRHARLKVRRGKVRPPQTPLPHTLTLPCNPSACQVAASLQNPYSALGIPASSDDKTIKRAYRKLALQWHPDVSKNPDAEAVFLQLTGR
jgi:hypothetical protein